jgi:hypothetical protein
LQPLDSEIFSVNFIEECLGQHLLLFWLVDLWRLFTFEGLNLGQNLQWVLHDWLV